MKNNYKTFKDLKIGYNTEVFNGIWIQARESKEQQGKYSIMILKGIYADKDGDGTFKDVTELFDSRSFSYRFTPEQITKIMLKIQGKPNALQMAWVYTFTVLQALLYIVVRISYTFSIHKGMPSLKFWKTEEEMIQKDIRRLVAIIIGLSIGSLMHKYLAWYVSLAIIAFYLLLNLIVAKVKVNKYKRKNK